MMLYAFTTTGYQVIFKVTQFVVKDLLLTKRDVRVFHPNVKSYHHLQLPSAYRLHEKRAYDQRIQEVEHGFKKTPLVFSTSRGMGASATVMYKHLAFLLSIKREESYTAVIAWIQCHLCFSLATMCLRGARSHHRTPQYESITLPPLEGKTPPWKYKLTTLYSY